MVGPAQVPVGAKNFLILAWVGKASPDSKIFENLGSSQTLSGVYRGNEGHEKVGTSCEMN